MREELLEMLRPYGQEGALRFWDQLSEASRDQLGGQLKAINWDLISELVESHVSCKPEVSIPDDLREAPFFSLNPETDAQKERYAKAKERGAELLSEGRCAIFTVAGGQGTRLGYDGPKGTYRITPVKDKSLFQYFAESLARHAEIYGHVIPWYIMTSALNDQATREYFAENDYFGLNANDVIFFSQGTMPAIDYNGKVILQSPDSLALAPDGHGGSLLALRRSGALDDMKARGVDYISYFQVDNPLVSVIDPLFIGLHDLEDSQMSARMLVKTGPKEKLGNFCVTNGRLLIIEYSDLPDDLAYQRLEDGRLRFVAGSPAIHVLSRLFVEELTEGEKLRLPWHRADKKIPAVNASGETVKPEEPNGVKLESFIFDALPLAKNTMILEADRDEEFAPVKNKEGVDSAVSCREMLIARDAKWLEEQGGVAIPRDENAKPNCVVELSPRSFVRPEDVAERAKTGQLETPQPGATVYYE